MALEDQFRVSKALNSLWGPSWEPTFPDTEDSKHKIQGTQEYLNLAGAHCTPGISERGAFWQEVPPNHG